jgi:hypothetical protein
VPAWYVAPLEMNEGTPWGQGYNKSTRLQCRKRPKYRPLPNLLVLIPVTMNSHAWYLKF